MGRNFSSYGGRDDLKVASGTNTLNRTPAEVLRTYLSKVSEVR